MTPTDATDEQLLAAIRKGDRDALEELYERHAAWLLLRLRRRGADGQLAEEVLQDTFLAVWRKPQTHSGRGEVGAWIWGIGIRRLIDRLRRNVSAPSLPRRRDPIVASAEDELLLRIEFGDLAGALSTLSPELHAVVQATVLDGLTTKEAARLLGIPSGTVKTRMMRARAQLREALT